MWLPVVRSAQQRGALVEVGALGQRHVVRVARVIVTMRVLQIILVLVWRYKWVPARSAELTIVVWLPPSIDVPSAEIS